MTALLLFAGALSMAFWLIDEDVVKRKVEQRVSAAIGGEMRYESMALGLLPVPQVSIRGLGFSIADIAHGQAAAVDVRVALLPLLFGKVQLRQIRIEQPELTVQLAASGTAEPWPDYRATLEPMVTALVRDAQGVTLEIEVGTLALMQQGRRIIALSEVAGQAEVSADVVKVAISAASDRWRSAQASLNLVPGTLAATAKLKINALDAGSLPDQWLAGGQFRLRPGLIDGNLEIMTDGRSSMRGSLVVNAPRVFIARAERSLDLGATGFNLDFNREATTLVLALKNLHAGDLLSGVSGSLRAGTDGSTPTLELRVPEVDLRRARDAALALVGDAAIARAWITPVESGRVGGLQLRATAKDWTTLGRLQAVHGEAQLAHFAYSLPASGITVKDGVGRITLADGRLQASELSGAVGKSVFKNGALKVRLAPVATFEGFSASVDADLDETLVLARHLGRRAGTVMPSIESLHGRASGRVDYEMRKGKPHFVVKTRLFKAGGRLRNVPFPLEVSQGEIEYKGERLAVRGLAGNVGRSRFKEVTAELSLGAAPAVSAAQGNFALSFDELYPWLSSLEALRQSVSGLSEVSGGAEVELARLSGVLARPESFDFEALVRPQNLRIVDDAIPGALTLVSGMVGVKPKTLRLDKLSASLLDAKVTVTGAVQDYALPARSLQLALANGAAGAQSLEWARKQWSLPGKLMLRAPVTLPSGRIEWSNSVGKPHLLAQGAVGLAGGVQGEFELDWQPNNMNLQRLTLKDADSDATLALKWVPAAVEVSFDGRITNRTIERILDHPVAGKGALRGAFQASIDLGELQSSTATGKLEGEDFEIFEHQGIPVVIERIRLEAAGDVLQVQDSSLRLSGQSVDLRGSVRRSKDAFLIDARVTADKLDVRRLVAAFPHDKAVRPPAAVSWNLPVQGRVGITAAVLAYDTHALEQVDAVVTLASNRIVAETKQARLCDLTLPFTAAFVPGQVDVRVQVKASGANLARTVSCLAGEHFQVSGIYDLDAEFSASGRIDTLLHTARGGFRFEARDGRINRAEALNRTLALDEVAGRMDAPAAKAAKSGIDYENISATGTLARGRLRLERAVIDSPILGITLSGDIGLEDQSLDLQGLVAPLETVGRVAKSVPLLGDVIAASIVVVPVSIKGDFREPRVRVLEAAAIGATLVNVMSTTFKAPIKLLDSTVGKAKPER